MKKKKTTKRTQSRCSGVELTAIFLAVGNSSGIGEWAIHPPLSEKQNKQHELSSRSAHDSTRVSSEVNFFAISDTRAIRILGRLTKDREVRWAGRTSSIEGRC